VQGERANMSIVVTRHIKNAQSHGGRGFLAISGDTKLRGSYMIYLSRGPSPKQLACLVLTGNYVLYTVTSYSDLHFEIGIH